MDELEWILGPYEGWKVDLVKNSKGIQIHIKKKFSNDLLIIINDGSGYDYNNLKLEPERSRQCYSTAGFNVHMSCNGALQFKVGEFQELNYIVDRADTFIKRRKKQLQLTWN